MINYHSAALATEAISSARLASSVPLQVVVVDNSDEELQLRGAGADQLLAPEGNLGFAGGINFGLKHCRGDVVIIANPDVVFRASSIDSLAASLTRNVALSGPRFTWDEGDRWLMPPAEAGTRTEKLSEAISTRSERWRERRARARFHDRLRFWSLESPSRVDAVSGAVMCTRRDVLESLGGFDERFPLYFEEIDFMSRLRNAGFGIEYNPAAICRHLYNQSAAQVPSSSETFLSSERAYHLKWSGAWFVRLVESLASSRPWSGDDFQPRSFADPIEVPGPVAEYVVEASPLPSFGVATGFFPAKSEVRFPPEIWTNYRHRSLFLRVIHRATGRVASQVRFDKTD